MNIGTKSVLYGAHCFLLHPWFVAWAWWRLYGFPFDPRLWFAFFLHDLGYIGKPNMDGAEGERHVEFGAWVMTRLFDLRKPVKFNDFVCVNTHPLANVEHRYRWYCGKWGQLCLFHSRFYAKQAGIQFSRLCVADKLAIVLTPAWLYLPMARATGEIKEYMALAKAHTAAGEPKYASTQVTTSDEARWYADVQEYLRRWVETHKDGAADMWTPITEQQIAREAIKKGGAHR